jgi:hypothetical protein
VSCDSWSVRRRVVCVQCWQQAWRTWPMHAATAPAAPPF